MSLIREIFKKNLYSDNIPLKERVSLAYGVYKNDDEISVKKKEAKKFLKYALNLQHIKEKEFNSALENAMKDVYSKPKWYVKKENKNKIKETKFNEEEEQDTGHVLKINPFSVRKDEEFKTKYFNEADRSKYQVIISNGMFMKNGKKFDTSKMSSHKKKGFAAFTLNEEGEISCFYHAGVVYPHIRPTGHSSMNAGKNVIFAGEIEIKNGELVSITTHSGHYRPRQYSLYRLLQHFSDQGINISNAKIYTGDKINDNSIKVETLKGTKVNFYETKASDLFYNQNESLKSFIKLISNDVKEYKEKNKNSFLFRLKDKLTSSDLTDKRKNLARDFFEKLSDLLTNQNCKIDNLKETVEQYIEKNNNLSQGKSNSGRFHSVLLNIKNKIDEFSKNQIDNKEHSKEERKSLKDYR